VLWANGVQVGTAPNETGQVQPWHWEPVLRLTLSLVYTDNRLVINGSSRVFGSHQRWHVSSAATHRGLACLDDVFGGENYNHG
jgi:hypothetical protein